MPGTGSASSDRESFWISFTMRADLIREGAGSHADYVRTRLDEILADAGMSEGSLSTG